MIRWMRQRLCRHIYVSSPHWLLDTNGQKTAKVGLLVCAKCGYCSLSGIHPLAERAKGGGVVIRVTLFIVQTADGRYVGHRGTKAEAERLAATADHTRPENGPHKIARSWGQDGIPRLSESVRSRLAEREGGRQ